MGSVTLDFIKHGHPLRSRILNHYNSMVTSVQNHSKDRKGREHIIGVHIPAVHELEIVTFPVIPVGFGATGKTHHIDF